MSTIDIHNSGSRNINFVRKIPKILATTVNTISQITWENVDIFCHQVWFADIFGLFSCLPSCLNFYVLALRITDFLFLYKCIIFNNVQLRVVIQLLLNNYKGTILKFYKMFNNNQLQHFKS